MAVRLRLRRIGKKKMPMYHIVAADSRTARSGKFIEMVGRYEPLQNPMLISMKEERTLYWLKNGAVPTDTVRSLLQRTGLWMRWSMQKRGVDAAKIGVEMEKWQMLQAERRQRDAERKARRVAARKKARKTEEPQPTPAAAETTTKA